MKVAYLSDSMYLLRFIRKAFFCILCNLQKLFAIYRASSFVDILGNINDLLTAEKRLSRPLHPDSIQDITLQKTTCCQPSWFLTTLQHTATSIPRYDWMNGLDKWINLKILFYKLELKLLEKLPEWL